MYVNTLLHHLQLRGKLPHIRALLSGPENLPVCDTVPPCVFRGV